MHTNVILFSSNTSLFLFNFCLGIIKTMLNSGYRVYCLAPRDDSSHKLEELGVTYIEISLEGKSINPLRELKSLLAITKTIVRLKPSYVFNFTIKMNLYAGLVCRFVGIPYANNISGLGTTFLHDSIVFKLAQKLYGFANCGAEKVFLLNSDDKAIFIQEGLVKECNAVLIPGTGIDLQRFSYVNFPAAKPFIFLMISRLIADKGVREYVAAAKMVKPKILGSRFILMGSCSVSNKSAIPDEEITQWGKDGIIEYVGYQDDVRAFIRDSHVLVLPSYREGMPRTVLEAASMGRPAIVTDVPGCRQSIVHNKTGWLCKVKDIDDLAERMLKVANLPSEELIAFGQFARQRVETEFCEKIVIEQYLKCLSKQFCRIKRKKAYLG